MTEFIVFAVLLLEVLALLAIDRVSKLTDSGDSHRGIWRCSPARAEDGVDSLSYCSSSFSYTLDSELSVILGSGESRIFETGELRYIGTGEFRF